MGSYHVNTEDEILSRYEVRKSNPQKTEFIEYIKARLSRAGYDPEQDITIEERGKGVDRSRNIIVGDPEKAELLITAHYDTCAMLPFPNFMLPLNLGLFLLYQVVMAVVIAAITIAIPVGIGTLVDDGFWSPIIVMAGIWGLLILVTIQMLCGYRNPHTANDNTSGVISLTRILEALPQEHRSKLCIVYFDNEEKGLLGSKLFVNRHKKDSKRLPIINIDCIGDGDRVLMLASRKARKDPLYSVILEAFEHEGDETVIPVCRKLNELCFPSDQMRFSKPIGVCAMHKFGRIYYAGRIHMPIDTVCRAENIEYITRVGLRIAEGLARKESEKAAER